MLKDVTLGQFFPGDTFAHRLDPRTKLIFIVIYMAALFTAKTVLAYAVMAFTLAVMAAVSKTRVKMLVSGLKPLVIVLIFTAVLNILYTPGDTVLFKFWIFTATLEGVITAVRMMLRIIMLVMGTAILTYVTSPLALTDGLESLLKPLNKIKVPVHEMSMIMSIALRFIPTIIEETDKIMNAQKARGADFETGGILKKAKAMMPILVPLFVSSFRRADELAIAMESRCYHGGEGRTRMKVLTYKGIDALAVVFGLCVLALTIISGRYFL